MVAFDSGQLVREHLRMISCSFSWHVPAICRQNVSSHIFNKLFSFIRELCTMQASSQLTREAPVSINESIKKQKQKQTSWHDNFFPTMKTKILNSGQINVIFYLLFRNSTSNSKVRIQRFINLSQDLGPDYRCYQLYNHNPISLPAIL